MSYIRLGLEGGARLAHGGKRAGRPEARARVLRRADRVRRRDRRHADRARGDLRAGREHPALVGRGRLLARVNALDVGLTASIWTHDLDRAHRLASRVEAGYVWINGASTHHVGVPFGGYKQSGMGREESIEELLACTQIKNVNVTLRRSSEILFVVPASRGPQWRSSQTLIPACAE